MCRNEDKMKSKNLYIGCILLLSGLSHILAGAVDIKIWDTGQVETGNFHGMVAWPYNDSWVEVPRGFTGEVFNDLVLEGENFWVFLHGSEYNANFSFLKGGYIPGDWTGPLATPDAPSRKNEMYRSYDTPGGYRAYGEGSDTHYVLLNSDEEIIVRSVSYPKHKPDGDWAVTTDYRFLYGKRWLEIIPVHQASELGFHGETKIIVVPDGNGIGNDYVADAYDYANGGVGAIDFNQGQMMLDFFMEGDGIWIMTWPNPSTAQAYGIWQYDGWPCGWDYVDGEPSGILPNIWSSPFARFGENGDEPLYVGFLNGKWSHCFWNYQNINQYLTQGTIYSDWLITFSRSPRYHEDWTPLYPGIYRLIGRIDDNFYTQEIDLMNINNPLEYTMPVSGNLEYVLIYMYDRNTNTPNTISTPMDIYHEAILGIEENKSMGKIQQGYLLYQNQPNPFRAITTIRYNLPEENMVELVVYNIMGQKVKTLLKGNQKTGNYSIIWDGCDQRGNKIANGVYVYLLRTGDHICQRKAIIRK